MTRTRRRTRRRREEEGTHPHRLRGLADRVTRVPVDADNYSGLMVTKEYLVYAREGASILRARSYPADCAWFSIAEGPQGNHAGGEGRGLRQSPGTAAKCWCRKARAIKLYDVKPEGKSSAKTVSTDNLMVDRVPQQEWVEIFNEVFRRYRDFFYAENMNGYNWDALRDQYRPLVDYVAHRSDLNYVHRRDGGGAEQLAQPTSPAAISRFRNARQVALPGAKHRAGRSRGPLSHRENLPRPERRGGLSLAAHGSGSGRQGRRLHSADRRPRVDGKGQSLRVAARQGRPVRCS